MGDKHLIRRAGGPFPGQWVQEDAIHEWPPPERIDMPSYPGWYKRLSYSALGPTDPEMCHAIRGAEYEWVEEGEA
jgi:hypothetical protein